jgi:hypothetical protein
VAPTEEPNEQSTTAGDREDPLAIADDGVAPLINNTGADDPGHGDADAASS